MSGRKRKSSSKSTSSKSKRRRKNTKKSSTNDDDVVEIDFRKHVGLLGGLRLEKPNDAHSHIKKVRHFVDNPPMSLITENGP